MKKILFLFCLTFAINAHSADYYVSVSGTNSNKGTSPQKPFQTIQFAVDQMKPGDVCYIMEGVYRETVVFHNSGSKDAPIVLMPYKNQKVVVTGLDILKGWSKTADQKMWQAPLSWDLGRGKNQLFYKGEVMLEARYPNVPEKGLELPVKGLSKLWPTFGDFGLNNTTQSPTYVIYNNSLNQDQPDVWKGANYYGIHYDGWAAQTGIVNESAKGKITIAQNTSTWWFSVKKSYVPGDWGRGMLTGHRLALDTQGEWLLENGKMFFISPENANPEGTTEVKKRQLAFDFSDAAYVEVNNIDVIAASVCMRDAAFCKMDGCSLSYITHFTVFDDARNGHIDNVRDATPLTHGESAIYISGHHNSILNSKIQYSAGGGIYLDGYNHTIHNTLIDQCSYTCTYLANIMIGTSPEFYGGAHTITFNTISNSGRSLLHFDGNMQRDGRGLKFAGCLFANNHFFNGVLQGRDGGAIACYCTDLGAFNGASTEFFNNVMHDHFDPRGDSWNLGFTYLDNNSQNFRGHHNITWTSPGTVQVEQIFNPWTTNMTWTDCVYYPNQSLDYTRLTASQFPDGKPFLFGFQEGKKVEIPRLKNTVSVMVQPKGKTEMLKNNDNFVVKSVDFSQGWQSVRLEYSSQNKESNDQDIFNADQFLRIRHHRPTDPLVFFAENAEDRSSDIPKRQHAVERFVKNNSWLKFAGVPLGNGYKTLNILYSSLNPGAKWLEIRLGKPDGELALKVDLEFKYSYVRKGNPNLQTFVNLNVDLPESLKGTQDLCIVARGDDKVELFQLAQLRFMDYRGESRVNPGDRKIELRLDSPTGDKIADLYTTNTGGADKYRVNVANLKEGFIGKHDVYFVGRTSSSDVFVDRVKSISFEKSE
jgi:hypothetical protein